MNFKFYLTLSAALWILGSNIIIAHQHHRLAASETALHNSQRALNDANIRNNAYIAANRALNQRLHTLQTENNIQREQLHQALSNNSAWANTPIPETVKKALP